MMSVQKRISGVIKKPCVQIPVMPDVPEGVLSDENNDAGPSQKRLLPRIAGESNACSYNTDAPFLFHPAYPSTCSRLPPMHDLPKTPYAFPPPNLQKNPLFTVMMTISFSGSFRD